RIRDEFHSQDEMVSERPDVAQVNETSEPGPVNGWNKYVGLRSPVGGWTMQPPPHQSLLKGNRCLIWLPRLAGTSTRCKLRLSIMPGLIAGNVNLAFPTTTWSWTSRPPACRPKPI